MSPSEGRTDSEPVKDAAPDTSVAEENVADQNVADAEPAWKRRQRLAAIFGDGVPEQTRDDRDPGEQGSGKGEAWYREQVPPHHG